MELRQKRCKPNQELKRKIPIQKDEIIQQYQEYHLKFLQVCEALATEEKRAEQLEETQF